MTAILTASQTAGPYFHLGLRWLDTADLAAGASGGERITVAGQVFDGDGAPIPDAVLELWQANAHGRYAHPEDTQNKPLDPGFTGFGRVPTAAEGRFRFTTIKPGVVVGVAGGPQAPHINVTLFMRGQLTHLRTRIYFADDAANGRDPVLACVEPARRGTLLARPLPGEAGAYRWNIVMQGANETVFFDF
jgi:protocatechuate 3,4-dioxygenase alpha subunit